MGYCIVTRYHGPTNYRGSRIIATGPAPMLPAWDAAPGTIVPPTRATVAWDYGAGNPAPVDVPGSLADPSYDAARYGRYAGMGDVAANHCRAADAVAAKLRAAGWSVTVDRDAGASLPDDSGMVWPLRYGDAPGDPVESVARALTGPTSGANARRIAASVAANLARDGWHR